MVRIGFGEISVQRENTWIYSEKAVPGCASVGLCMSTKATTSIIEWKPVLERIIIARFYNKVRNITIINLYAPTEAAEEEEKGHSMMH